MANYYFHSLTDIFDFGKYEGLCLCDVLAIELSYIYWCQINIPEFYISNSLCKHIKELFPDFVFLSE